MNDLTNLNKKPLISVYMPTHNRGVILRRAIESVLSQSFTDIELIVVNDGSSDGTVNILKEYEEGYKNFIFYTFDQPKGACAARNYAINLAQGHYITGIDDDDEWLPNRLENFMLDKDLLSDHVFIYHDDYIIDSTNNQKSIYRKARKFSLSEFDKKNIVGNQIFTRTALLKKYLFDTQFPSAQDYELFYRIVKGEKKLPIKRNFITQNLFINHAHAQITQSAKKFSGYLMFYKKNKSDISSSSRKYQLFTLYLIRNKKMSLSTKLTLLTVRNIIRQMNRT